MRPMFHHAVPIAAAAGVIVMAGLLLERPVASPVAPPPESAQVGALAPDQVQNALDDMEMLREFNHLMRPDGAEPKM